MIRAEAKRHARRRDGGPRFVAMEDEKPTAEIPGPALSLAVVAAPESGPDPTEPKPETAAKEKTTADQVADRAAPADFAGVDTPVIALESETRTSNALQDALLSALEDFSATMQPAPQVNGAHLALLAASDPIQPKRETGEEPAIADAEEAASTLGPMVPPQNGPVDAEAGAADTDVAAHRVASDDAEANVSSADRAPESDAILAGLDDLTDACENPTLSPKEAGGGQDAPEALDEPSALSSSVCTPEPAALGRGAEAETSTDTTTLSVREPESASVGSQAPGEEQATVGPPEPPTASVSITASAATELSESPRSGTVATAEPADAPVPGEADVLDELIAALDSLHKAYRPSSQEEQPERQRLARRLLALSGPDDGTNDGLDESYDDLQAASAQSEPLDEMLSDHDGVPRLQAPPVSPLPPASHGPRVHPPHVSSVSFAPPPLQAARPMPGQSIVPVAPPALPSRMLMVAAPALDFGHGGAATPNTAIGFSAGFALAMAVGAALYACLLTF